MQNLINAILAWLAAMAVVVSTATPTQTQEANETEPKIVVVQTVQSTPTIEPLPDCYNSPDPACWDEFYGLYQNCPQQLVDVSGSVHVNDGYDLEFPELCRQWEYEHNPTPAPLPTETPQPTANPNIPTNTPAP